MQFSKKIKIANVKISKGSKAFIIAEAGVNHGGNIKIALRLVDIAVKARVDAIKFQAFRTENLILSSVKKAPYQKKTTGSSENQFQMLKKLELSKAEYLALKQYCDKKGILFLITPFDEQSLSELDELQLAAYKISSTDITNLPFLKKVAAKKKPIILSTGMSYFSEIKKALQEIHPINRQVLLMQCTGNYPIEDNEANLNVLNTYKEIFNILIGYSDHSVGIGASPYAVAMGAKAIEKHFTLDKSLPGPDHKASLDPNELVEFVRTIRKVEEYLGSFIKRPTSSELRTRKSLQKCFVAGIRIRKGESFTLKNIMAKRTGGVGISPINYNLVFGKTAKRNFEKDDIIFV